MKTISTKQREILQLLMDGWEIGIDTGMNPRAWIQKGGLGYGGESRDVHFNTFNSMRQNGLIEHNEEPYFSSPNHYHITQKGKEKLR